MLPILPQIYPLNLPYHYPGHITITGNIKHETAWKQNKLDISIVNMTNQGWYLCLTVTRNSSNSPAPSIPRRNQQTGINQWSIKWGTVVIFKWLFFTACFIRLKKFNETGSLILNENKHMNIERLSMHIISKFIDGNEAYDRLFCKTSKLWLGSFCHLTLDM